MAKENYITLPLFSATDESVRLNKEAILEFKVINLGFRNGQNQNWIIQVVVMPGAIYNLKTTGAPYATYAEAITARDTFVTAIPAI